MILYRTQSGLIVEKDNQFHPVGESSLNALLAHEDLPGYLNTIDGNGAPLEQFDSSALEAPIEDQEVWASGVTYYRSRSARIEESKDAGGGDFYDRVYSAERPELFFKAAQVLGVPPARCLVFEDAEPGFLAAKAAGMPYIDVRPYRANLRRAAVY